MKKLFVTFLVLFALLMSASAWGEIAIPGDYAPTLPEAQVGDDKEEVTTVGHMRAAVWYVEQWKLLREERETSTWKIRILKRRVKALVALSIAGPIAVIVIHRLSTEGG